MSKPKLTEWFSANVKPSIVGIYERDDKGTFMHDGHPNFSYWNGSLWSWSDTSPLRAWKMRGNVSCEQELPWRGLADAASNENGQRGSEA